MKITIKEKPESQGGYWLAFIDETCINATLYFNEDDRKDALFKCIDKAKAKIPVIIELTLPIDQVTPVNP